MSQKAASALLVFCVAAQSIAFGAPTGPQSKIVRGLEFIRFGPAEVTMGCPTNAPIQWEDDVMRYPATNTFVGEFWFGRTPISVERYLEFLNAEGFKPAYANRAKMFKFIEQKGNQFVPRKNMAKRAIGGVTFDGAVAYCKWLSNVAGQKCRLPMNAEWEYVAKGKENRIYPWGNTPTRDFPFSAIPGTRTDLATPEGVFDLIGPVYQWCGDDAAPRLPKPGAVPGPRKVTRGGTIFRTGFINEKLHVPPNWRWTASELDDADFNQGFRVVIDP